MVHQLASTDSGLLAPDFQSNNQAGKRSAEKRLTKLPMSPRPKNIKTIFDPPKFKGYKPFGYYAASAEPVLLLFEEYTALKLCDYELMTQSEAAQAMGVSRPTFTRLYERARRKIALALAEARNIEVERGRAFFDHDWYHCKACNIFFTIPVAKFSAKQCPICHSKNLEEITTA